MCLPLTVRWSSQDQGVVKILSDKRYGEILGVHILAPLAMELVDVASLAMRHELGADGSYLRAPYPL
jgi:dihydrolipoamide dehydrogenase